MGVISFVFRKSSNKRSIYHLNSNVFVKYKNVTNRQFSFFWLHLKAAADKALLLYVQQPQAPFKPIRSRFVYPAQGCIRPWLSRISVLSFVSWRPRATLLPAECIYHNELQSSKNALIFFPSDQRFNDCLDMMNCGLAVGGGPTCYPSKRDIVI